MHMKADSLGAGARAATVEDLMDLPFTLTFPADSFVPCVASVVSPMRMLLQALDEVSGQGEVITGALTDPLTDPMLTCDHARFLRGGADAVIVDPAGYQAVVTAGVMLGARRGDDLPAGGCSISLIYLTARSMGRHLAVPGETMPVRALPVNPWLRELRTFVMSTRRDGVVPSRLADPFFTGVAAPLHDAEMLVGIRDLAAARQMVNQCTCPAWRLACAAWLDHEIETRKKLEQEIF